MSQVTWQELAAKLPFRLSLVAEEIGDGRVEIAGHMLAFAQDGYAGCVSIETHWSPPDGDRESNTCRTFAGLVSILHEI